MRADDANLLNEVPTEMVDYKADLKALILRAIHPQEGRVGGEGN